MISITNSFYSVYPEIPLISLIYILSIYRLYKIIRYLLINLTLVVINYILSLDSIITLYKIKFSSIPELSNIFSVC